MALVTFTANIQRHIPCPPMQVPGQTIREILEQVFAYQPLMRSYILDDQGGVRKHMVIFVDGAQIRDPTGLSDRVSASGTVYVMQALSGG